MALRNAFENLGLDSTLQAIRDRLPSALGGNGGVKVEQQNSIPAGSNTIGNVNVIDSGGVNQASVSASGAVKVDGSAVTQPVSATSLPLPTNAATSTKQSDGSQKTQVVDGSGNVITSTSNALDVNLKSGTTGLALDSTLTSGNQLARITDGTNTANVGTGDASNNFLLIGKARSTVTYSTTTAQAVASTDVSGFSWVSIHQTSNGTNATTNFQVSNDNVNWLGLQLFNANSATGTATNSTNSASAIMNGPLGGARYFRLNVTGISAGTTAGTILFSTLPQAVQSLGVAATPTGASAVAGTITTSASSVVSSSLSNLGDMALVTVHGTYAGVSFGITMSDDGGTTFYPVSIYDASAQAWLPPSTTISPGTNATKHYWVSVSPFSNVIKVLASAYTSGTANIRIGQGYTAGVSSTMSQIMDSAGNNRGANVTAANALQVDGSATVQPVTNDTASLNSGATKLTPTFALINANTTGGTTIVNAVASKKILVLQYVLVATSAVNVKFQSHVTPTDLTGLLYLGTNTGVSSPYSPVGLFQTVAGEALDINLSGNIAVGGHLVYVTV